MTSVNTVSH